jgi:nicotinamide riboside kinase
VNRQTFEHGLVIGKFYPPHRGHEYLVRTALLHARRVTVLVLASSAERLSMQSRARWLRECFPHADGLRIVAELDDLPMDFDDAEIWRAHVDVMKHALGRSAEERAETEIPIDVVFSSETWVSEYGRECSANLLAVARSRDAAATPSDVAWDECDFVHIAEEQTRREQEAAREGGPVLVCDTDALVTGVWHERYRGHASASVAAVASAMPPRALYLLTDHRDVEFEDDGLRDGEHLRASMHERFASVLSRGTVPWRLVSGTPAERTDAALRHVAEAMPTWWPFTEQR